MDKAYEVSLPLYGPAQNDTKISYVINDNGVYPLTIRLLDKDESPYAIPDGVVSEINIMTKQGSQLKRTGEITDAANGVILLKIDAEDMPDSGRYHASVTLTQDDEYLTWPEFSYYVRRSLRGGGDGSTSIIVNEATANASAVYTDAAVKKEAIARVTGDDDTLKAANAYTDGKLSGLTPDYNELDNLPSLGGKTIAGNKTPADYGLATAADVAGLSEELSNIQLTPGAEGIQGEPGESAFQIAVRDGFVGTEPQWLASLKGADGTNGATGATGLTGAKGDKGDTGATGAIGPQGDKGDKGDAGVDGYNPRIIEASDFDTAASLAVANPNNFYVVGATL